MIFPKLKSLMSPDLAESALPNDAENFSIPFSADVGPHNEDGAEVFYFEVVSGGFLISQRRTTWGRGLLFLPEFSWPTLTVAIDQLLMRSARATWPEVTTELNKYFCWDRALRHDLAHAAAFA